MQDYQEVPNPNKTFEITKISLQRDYEAEASTPKLLEGVPYYGIEEIIHKHEIDIPNGVYRAYGFEGIGFAIQLEPNSDLVFLKIFRNTAIPKPILKDFLQKMKVRLESLADKSGGYISHKEYLANLDYIAGFEKREATKEAEENSTIERQAIALHVGNRVLPANVPKLQAIWTYNGKPVGYSCEYITGEMHKYSEYKDDPLFQEKVSLLFKNKIMMDNIGKNIIVKPNGQVVFIDMNYFSDINE
ncbi:MAG TPA: hypothetical protein VK338_06725 [Candidatus Nitrosocosmicus sp.]|nr:hypothetical protein [Candidatus Nitrosocosmicus sp.]